MEVENCAFASDEHHGVARSQKQWKGAHTFFRKYFWAWVRTWVGVRVCTNSAIDLTSFGLNLSNRSEIAHHQTPTEDRAKILREGRGG